MILVDSNVWLRLSDASSAQHQMCRKAVDELRKSVSLAIAAQVLIEVWAVASRPIGSNGLGLSAAKVDHLIQAMELLSTTLPESEDMAARWLELAHRYHPIGKPCHDLRLVALAHAHGVRRILTLNTADFARYREIEAVHPSSIAG